MSPRRATLSMLSALVATLVLVSCENLPYRVEWGFKKDFEKRDAEGAAPRNVDPVTLQEAWITWEARHDQLVRRVERRAPGAAIPMDTLENTVMALNGIRRHHPEQETLVAEVAADYERIGGQLSRLSPAVASHRLQQVASKLKALRK